MATERIPFVMGLVAVLALERQTLMIAAFVALAAAGIVVSAGAWVLLWRSRRGSRTDEPQP